MMYPLGLVLGVIGAAWHLAVTRRRATEVVRGHAMRAWLLLPVGLAGPLLAFYVALSLGGDRAAWAFLAGALLTSAFILARAGRARR